MHIVGLLNTILDLVKDWYFGWTFRQLYWVKVNYVQQKSFT